MLEHIALLEQAFSVLKVSVYFLSLFRHLEILVIFAVILNSIVIAIYDNADRDNVTQYN